MSALKQKNQTMGMFLFISTEMMFFAGIISAFLVSKAGAPFWPPAQQPRLPVESTAINTFFLLLSAVTLFLGILSEKKKDLSMARKYFGATILLGTLFVFLQGREWVELIQFGLTTSSSLYGAFFYFIVGAHGLHALIGLVLMALGLYWQKKNGTNFNQSIKFFWGFVVALWPVLYWLVYFN